MDIKASVLTTTIIFVTWYVGNAVSDPSDAVILRFHVRERINDVLEVRYNGDWGSICFEGVDDKAAKVACRQMGFRDGKPNTRATVVAAENLTIVLDEVHCTGEDFGKCAFVVPTGNCKFAQELNCESDLHVALDGLFNVSLIGSPNHAHKGILHATKAGATDAVCYNESGTATQTIAGIVCKQMGYSGVEKQTAANASSYSGFFTATCKGTELTLANCTLTHGTSCSANSVIDIECKLDNATQAPFAVRLSQSSHVVAGASSGTVEVKKYGKWGVICDTGWDIKDANVVCRQLGFKEAVPTTGFPTNAKFGQGTGIVFWNNINCSGDEPSIAECKHDAVLGACNSVIASGVICSSETLPTFDICSNETITIPAGVSFLRSPGYPKPFNYTAGTTCSWSSKHLTAATNLTLYIHQKMFQKNHVESLTFYNDSSEIQLYGDDSSAGPFSFTNTDNFTIQFESDDSAGEGMLNIQVKATKPVEFACTKTVKGPSTTPATTTTNTSTNGTASSFELRDNESEDKTGMIIGIVIGAIVLITIIVVGIVLWKKYKTRNTGRGSVRAFEKGTEGSKQEQKGGVVNHTFTGDNTEMKRNDSESADGLKGTGGIDVITETGFITDEPKEPETGERKPNGRIGRPASGSEVKVDIDSSATADNANSQYAVVNKVRRGQKGPAFVIPNETPNPRAKPPPYVYANNLKQDIDNGNINDDSVQPADEYEEVRKPQTFVPGQSAAYADIELGAGGAPSILEQGPPVSENKTKKDKKKNKKENEKDKGDKKEAKKGEKKKGKKGDNKENKNENNEADQKEDRKKSQIKGKKGDKNDAKKDFGSSDDISGLRPVGDSCAVPMSGDFSTYAEVGQVTGAGQIVPAGGSQPDESENVYDFSNRPGPNYRPGPSDPTYGVLNFQA